MFDILHAWRWVFAFIAAVASVAKPAFAETQTLICAELLGQGIRDVSSTNMTENRFNELRSNVCNSNYDSYAKASSNSASGGIDVVGVFGVSGGGANAASEYSTKWQHLCSSNYNQALSDTSARTYFSTINANLLKSFDNCVNTTTERFIRYVQPSADGRTLI